MRHMRLIPDGTKRRLEGNNISISGACPIMIKGDYCHNSKDLTLTKWII